MVSSKSKTTKLFIKKLLSQEESHNLEFKSSLVLRNEIGQTISAFANTKGGTVLVGVSDKGEVLGVDIGKKTTAFRE